MKRGPAYLVAIFGALVAAAGVWGYVDRGSKGSLFAGGGLGLLMLVFGLLASRGSRKAAWTALVLLVATGVAMAERLIRGGDPRVSVPILVVALVLAGVVLAALRRAGNATQANESPAR